MAVINLKAIPQDILRYLLKIQGEIKSEKNIAQYSLEQTVYRIVKEHQAFNKIQK